MFDLIVREANLWDRRVVRRADVGITGGRIVAIEPSLPAGGEERSAAGCLLVPGLVDTHLHLDKSRLPGDALDGSGGLHQAIARTAAEKSAFTVEDVLDRASQTLERCIVQGTNHIRTHVEVDPAVGLRGFEGVLAAADAYSWAVDVQICVFPQEGLVVGTDTQQLLELALKGGATVIGGAPYTDPSPREQIDLVFEMANRFDVDIDLHLDLADTTDDMQVEYVCAKTEEWGFGGRVTVGHVTQLSLLPPPRVDEIAVRLAGAGVAVTSLPSTDLYLMGRNETHARPRGVAPLEALRSHDVACSLATNNVLNSFTPYGDCSLLRMANLYANVSYVSTPAGLADCFSMITDQAARIMGVADYEFAVGGPADMVLLDARDPSSAVAELPSVLWGIKSGRPTFTASRPIIHRAEGVMTS